jgi:Fe-S-cluster containining protein
MTPSTSFDVRRPVVRSYLPAYLANAVKHVRAGGHAVIRATPSWYLLLPCDDDGDMPELAAWALLDLQLTKSTRVRAGEAKGLVRARITRELRYIVEGWIERDSVEKKSTTVVTLDCVACGACCRDNDVLLDKDDFARWREAGRTDLMDGQFLRARKRKLKLLPNGDCVHLCGNMCGIYEVRPDNCRAFPAGSECCLFARDEAREKAEARAKAPAA